MTSQQLDPFPAKTRPRNKNGAIFKPSLKHQKSRIQPNQKFFSLEHFRKKVDLFRRIKRSTVRCTLKIGGNKEANEGKTHESNIGLKGSLPTSVLFGRLLLFLSGTLARIIANEPTSHRAIISLRPMIHV